MQRRPVTRALAALVATAAAASAACDRSKGATAEPAPAAGETRDGSVVVNGAPPLAFDPPPAAYEIDYRVTDGTGKKATSSVEEDAVRRPYDGRQVIKAGKSVSTTTAVFGRYRIRIGAQPPQVLIVPPGPPPNDVRIDAVLAAATKDGYIERREQRRVLGRPCQVYRTMTTGRPGAFEPSERDDSTHSDLCFDTKGLLLEEVTFRAGKQVHRRIATRVVDDAHLDDSVFDTAGEATPLEKGGGSLRPVTNDSRPPGGEFYELDNGGAIDGFTRRGRYTVVPPQPENFNDPSRFDFQRAGVVDVYERGVDAIVVERGGTRGSRQAFAPSDRARKVDLGSLGTGELILGITFSEVRVALPDTHYLRVVGSVDPDQLVAIALRLHPEPEGELHFID